MNKKDIEKRFDEELKINFRKGFYPEDVDFDEYDADIKKFIFKELSLQRKEIIERVDKDINKLPREVHDFGWGEHEWIDICKIQKYFRQTKESR